ncbi:TolC family protein [Chitiniphilus shinanonensis]|uniref:TolC family protein n=2 Tax=Chitiniphilus shinanonensis TaxID=553088 RepID=UPI00301FFD40
MFPFRIAWLAAVLGAASVPVHALTLAQALDAAQGHAPELAASAAATAAAQALTRSAGALPDPKLSIWIDDLPTEGDDAYRIGSAKRAFSLMQEVPNAGLRAAERRIADARLQGSEAQARYARLGVTRDTTLAWLALYYLDRKAALLDAQEAEIRRGEAAALARLKGGDSADGALAARLERAQLDDARDELARDRLRAQAQLARWVGTEAAAQPVSGELPDWLGADAPAGDDLLAEQPEIRAAATLLDGAQAELAMAQAAKRPNWGVELGWGLDAMDQGMAMLKFTFELPIFAASRQDPKIAAAYANVRQRDAERETRLADYRRQIAETRAEQAALRAQLDRLNTRTLPLIEQQAALALARLRAAAADGNAVLDARKARLAAQWRGVTLEADLADATARLHFLTGAHP